MRNTILSDEDKANLLIARDALAENRVMDAILIATTIPALAIVDNYQTAARALAYLDPSPKVGDVLVNTWGYEQTNVNYYEVVAITTKRVRVREIAGRVSERGQYDDTIEPDVGNYLLPPCIHCHQDVTSKNVKSVCRQRPIVGPIDELNSCHMPGKPESARGFRYRTDRGVVATPTTGSDGVGYSIPMRHGWCSLYLGGGTRQTGAMYGH